MNHPLTQIVLETKYYDDYDKAIRSWLEEKAKQIETLGVYHDEESGRYGFKRADINKILSLNKDTSTSEPEKCVHSYEPSLSMTGEYSECGKCHYRWYISEHYSKPKEEVMSDSWTCKNHPMGYICDETFKFCPLCATPRPVKKSLAEKFEETFSSELCGCGNYQKHSKMLAEIARQHFEGMK